MKKIILAIMILVSIVSNGLALEVWESPKTLDACKMDVNHCASKGWDALTYKKYDDAIILLDMACKSGLTFGCLKKAKVFDSKGWDGYDPKRAKTMFAAILSEAVKKCENGEGSECYVVGYMHYVGDAGEESFDLRESNHLKYYNMACKLGYTKSPDGNPCEFVKYRRDEAIRKAQLAEAKK